MDASTRLYKRLGEIPEDPNDPDSLDDLIVCAFGAFERYYVCWKTKGGEFKQGAHTQCSMRTKWELTITRWLRSSSCTQRLALSHGRHDTRFCVTPSRFWTRGGIFRV